jgi:hypothetical protein
MRIGAKLVALLVLPICILGCAGVTLKRDYLPPKSEEGLSCIHQCEGTKVQCRENETTRTEQERNKAKKEYEQCLAYRGVRCTDMSYQFSPHYERCEVGYDLCFERCGGQIIEEKR